MRKREVDLSNARVADGRRITMNLSGQPEGEWSTVFDHERLLVLKREGVDYIAILVGNETIQVDVFDGGSLDDAKNVVQEIVDRTNAHVDDESGTGPGQV